jgi:hypothetical protein
MNAPLGRFSPTQKAIEPAVELCGVMVCMETLAPPFWEAAELALAPLWNQYPAPAGAVRSSRDARSETARRL